MPAHRDGAAWFGGRRHLITGELVRAPGPQTPSPELGEVALRNLGAAPSIDDLVPGGGVAGGATFSLAHGVGREREQGVQERGAQG